MFAYDFDRLNTLLKRLIQKNVSPDAWKWLENEGRNTAAGELSRFNIAFVSMPRKTARSPLAVTAEEQAALKDLRTHFTINGWTTDQLARVWLLMQLDATEKAHYIDAIENLFLNAEMSELVALYSALPVLAYPEAWRKRCAEGVRSNIGQVLDAVICNNPYPAEQLDQAAWNQLVLKAIFTEKPVLEIVGLKTRRNINLARSLSDYAHERWAARRDVNPLLWVCVGPFIDESNFADIQRLFSTGDMTERRAAALASVESSYEPAKRMVSEQKDMRADIDSGKVSWQGIADRMGKVNV
jgi:hypothetical protein